MKIAQHRILGTAPWLLLILPMLSLADGETLPDTAPPENEDSEAVSDRLAAEEMSLEELEALFLSSPVELDTEESRSGGTAVGDDRRISETIILQRERERERALQNVEMPSQDLPPPPLPTYSPIRDL